MSADDWVGGSPEYLKILEEKGVLAEVERIFDMEEEAALSGDDSALRAFYGEPLSGKEAMRRLRALVNNDECGHSRGELLANQECEIDKKSYE